MFHYSVQLQLSATSGPEHDPVHPGAGPANPAGPAVRGEDGGPAPRPGDQVQAGGGESQAEHRQAIQGTEPDLELTQAPFLSVSVAHHTQPYPFSVRSHCGDVFVLATSHTPKSIPHAESKR